MAKKKDETPFPGRVIGFDPGTVNFAWAIDGPDGLEDHDVIEGIGEDVLELPYFEERVWRVLERFAPDAATLERYHPRAENPNRAASYIGNTERVNLMIGIVLRLCTEREMPHALITAATHKTWAKKYNGAQKKGGHIDTHTCPDYEHLPTDHEADAANLGRYGRLKTFAGGKATCHVPST